MIGIGRPADFASAHHRPNIEDSSFKRSRFLMSGFLVYEEKEVLQLIQKSVTVCDLLDDWADYKTVIEKIKSQIEMD